MPSFLAAYRALDDGRHRAEFYRVWRAGQSAGFTLPQTFTTMGPREASHVEAGRAWLFAGAVEGRGSPTCTRTGSANGASFS